MPIMIRPSKSKAKKIAYSILGTPSNITEFDKNKRSKREKTLIYSESRLAR